jgi:hypothetical protein
LDVRRIAKTFGILFLLTWVTGIVGRVLLEPVYSERLYILGDGGESAVLVGAVFEFLLIVANIGTAVVLYPIAKRYTQTGAVGYVTARIVECAFIAIGLLSLLTVVSLRQDLTGGVGGDASSLVTVADALTATYEWAFLFGPGLMAGVANGLILGYVMYRSALIPRRLAMLGLAGGAIHVVGFGGVLFGAVDAGSPGQLLFSIGEIAWEATLPIYVLRKGFKTAGAITLDDSTATVAPSMATA